MVSEEDEESYDYDAHGSNELEDSSKNPTSYNVNSKYFKRLPLGPSEKDSMNVES
jgi:hypothetical protein